jgi:hypothetical protein
MIGITEGLLIALGWIGLAVLLVAAIARSTEGEDDDTGARVETPRSDIATNRRRDRILRAHRTRTGAWRNHPPSSRVEVEDDARYN